MTDFTCPCCGKVSHNPNDLEQGYCGACHWWTADPVLGPPHLEAPCAARAQMRSTEAAELWELYERAVTEDNNAR